MQSHIETHNLHGDGPREHVVYDMPGEGWDAITDVPCPVEGCGNTVLWYEAGYVPGYRVCMAETDEPGVYDMGSLRHRFLAGSDLSRPTLILDE